MDIAIMIEGQAGLNWPRWQGIAGAVEELGFSGLYRSDHFTGPETPDQDSLELWVSLTWLADHTRRIDFGPLVSPVSFRDPVFTARMALAVDDLSAGRLALGVGAGWQEREHRKFGYDLLDLSGRIARLQEGLEVITRLCKTDEPVSFDGTFYHLDEAVLLPRPRRPGGPPIVVGGGKSVLDTAARYADEWNVGFVTPGTFANLSARLSTLLEQRGRRPGDVRRSLMSGLAFGRDEEEVRRKLAAYGGPDGDSIDRIVVGTQQAVVDRLGEFAEAGVERVMLQWLDLDDLDGLAALAQAILPHFS